MKLLVNLTAVIYDKCFINDDFELYIVKYIWKFNEE